MSLISEALKEAQRERTERAGPKAAATNPSESFFPYPSSKKVQGSNPAMLIGASLVMVAAIAFAVVRLRGPSKARPFAPVVHVPAANPIQAPVIASPPVADSAAKPSAPLANPTNAAIDSKKSKETKPIAATIPANAVAAPAEKPAAPSPVSKPPVDSVASVPAAPIVPPKPIASSPANNMRIVADPTSLHAGDSLFTRAYNEHVRGNLDAAADLYERALQKKPVPPELYNNYGALLAARGKYGAAIPMYNMALEANRNDPKIWINLGDAYHAMGRRADAISDYFEAAKLDPANARVKVYLANEYLSIGDTLSARHGFEDAVAANPKDAPAHYAFASFFIKQHDYRSAERELKAFIDLAPGQVSQTDIDSAKAYLVNLRSQIR